MLVAIHGLAQDLVGNHRQADRHHADYVSNSQAGSVSVIDPSSGAVVESLLAGEWPGGIATSPDGTRADVANRGSNDISVIDTTSHSLVETISTGAGPTGVGFTNRFAAAEETLVGPCGQGFELAMVLPLAVSSAGRRRPEH